MKWFRHRAWVPVSWVLALANAVSVWFAGRAEPWHATIHIVLALLFAVAALRLARWHARQRDRVA